jgi:hypothetical protein
MTVKNAANLCLTSPFVLLRFFNENEFPPLARPVEIATAHSHSPTQALLVKFVHSSHSY